MICLHKTVYMRYCLKRICVQSIRILLTKMCSRGIIETEQIALLMYMNVGTPIMSVGGIHEAVYCG